MHAHLGAVNFDLKVRNAIALLLSLGNRRLSSIAATAIRASSDRGDSLCRRIATPGRAMELSGEESSAMCSRLTSLKLLTCLSSGRNDCSPYQVVRVRERQWHSFSIWRSYDRTISQISISTPSWQTRTDRHIETFLVIASGEGQYRLAQTATILGPETLQQDHYVMYALRRIYTFCATFDNDSFTKCA